TATRHMSADRLVADDEQAWLVHVLDRVLHALASEAGLLHAAVGHVVDAETGHVADHHAADLEPVPGAHGMRQAAGEYAALQPERAGVDGIERGIEIIERLQAGDGAKHLLAVQVAVRRHLFHQRGRHHVAFARAPDKALRTAVARRIDPGLDAP